MQKTFVFVKALSGKSEKGYDYNFVVVSNGIVAGNIANPEKLDFSDYKEGDDITLEIDVKPNMKSWDVIAKRIIE